MTNHDALLDSLREQVTNTETALLSATCALHRWTKRRLKARAELARMTAWATKFSTDAQAQAHLNRAARRWRRHMQEPMPDVTVARAAFDEAVSLLHAAVAGIDGGAA